MASSYSLASWLISSISRQAVGEGGEPVLCCLYLPHLALCVEELVPCIFEPLKEGKVVRMMFAN